MVIVKKDITDIKNNYATIVKLDSEITSVNAKILTTESDLKLQKTDIEDIKTNFASKTSV